ncbi:MAG: group 1 truncated hemoglobin [Myxococcota bacterium]
MSEALLAPERVEAALRAFYASVYADPMIGFYFEGVDQERLIARETELVATLLGSAAQPYRGRTMQGAHARHRILSGHFDRRMVLLERALDQQGIAGEARRRWLEHAASLRQEIVGGDCT